MFSQFSSQFDVAVKNLAKMAAEQTTKCQVHYKREFSNIGKCFTGLGQAMEMDGGGYNPGLNRAVMATGECYEEVGRMYEEQPRLDWEHVADMMHDYKGLLAGWPQVLQIHSVSNRNGYFWNKFYCNFSLVYIMIGIYINPLLCKLRMCLSNLYF